MSDLSSTAHSPDLRNIAHDSGSSIGRTVPFGKLFLPVRGTSSVAAAVPTGFTIDIAMAGEVAF
ncbi:hypothetical protein [Amycolatopsis sp. cmx-4-54]|uniref:hypothetical protein n=1 Tax=Amycolatopsis sp. cmx-4-54 TaxID=2790936 RepID=UPI00397D3703